jgi:hypothetical protein
MDTKEKKEERVEIELDDREILGRDFNSLTHSVKDEEGYWRVIVTITDKVLYAGSDSWIVENVEAMSVDKDFHNAVETAMRSSLGFIVEHVYQKGFPGLVEFREFERKVKALSEAS